MTRRRPLLTTAVTLLLGGTLALPAVALTGVPGLPSSTEVLPSTAAAVTGDYGFQGEGSGRVNSADLRAGSLAPTAAQLAAVERLGATVRWNALGTPASLAPTSGHLSAPREGAAADVARAFLREQADLLGLTAAQVDALELLNDSPFHDATDLRRLREGLAAQNTDVAHAVLFRQRFGELAAGQDGLVFVGVTRHGEVTFLTSSLTRESALSGTPRLDLAEAYVRAAADVGRTVDVGALEVVEELTEAGFTTLRVPGSEELQYGRLRAVPTPQDGVRPAWETVVLDNSHVDEHGHAVAPAAYIHFIDAETGEVLLRHNRVDHFSAGGVRTQAVVPDNPRWKVFSSNPALSDPAVEGSEPATDTRETWCWQPEEGCDRVVGNSASRAPWDVDPRSGLSTFTTSGNNARTAPSFVSPLTPDAGAAYQPFSPTREYDFPFTNQWFRESCAPTTLTSPTKNDLDAATVNLFVGHNQIHDWSYYLGFTEQNYNLQASSFGNGQAQQGRVPTAGLGGDPELGQSQAGALSGPSFLGRDNANQITLQDGIPGITNQYLWQPLQAGFYAPCVDGAYDASVIAHEYGHAIQNRMVGGPDGNLSGAQASSMGESWSDLTAIEYLNAYGFAGENGEDVFAVGGYVTGDPDAGIRNFNMSRSPLNYSNIEVDGNGATSPHADGEIWSATNFTVRQALIEAYDEQFPADDAELQRRCADGERAADTCPGNRRWIQIVHDAFLLQPSATDMVMAKDAYLAADRMRFDGANQQVIADAFAQRGLGVDAVTNGSGDRNPVPSFVSPVADSNGGLRLRAVDAQGGQAPVDVTLHVGRFEARTVPAAVSAPGASTVEMPIVQGSYELLLSAPGYALTRATVDVVAGKTANLVVPMRRNLAEGAEVTGDGYTNPQLLVDGTEATNVALLGSDDIRGTGLTVELGEAPQQVSEVQVSAALRPANSAVQGDTAGQNRFSALRSFAISTCDATRADCSTAEGFTAAGEFRDAFPAGRPRPTLPDLALRSFALDAPVSATHVRITVLDNQCTGGPLYTGEANPDADPVNDPDCVDGQAPGVAATAGNTSGSITQAGNVRIAELQVLAPTKR